MEEKDIKQAQKVNETAKEILSLLEKKDLDYAEALVVLESALAGIYNTISKEGANMEAWLEEHHRHLRFLTGLQENINR